MELFPQTSPYLATCQDPSCRTCAGAYIYRVCLKIGYTVSDAHCESARENDNQPVYGGVPFKFKNIDTWVCLRMEYPQIMNSESSVSDSKGHWGYPPLSVRSPFAVNFHCHGAEGILHTAACSAPVADEAHGPGRIRTGRWHGGT